jgi:hypothetical protein
MIAFYQWLRELDALIQRLFMTRFHYSFQQQSGSCSMRRQPHAMTWYRHHHVLIAIDSKTLSPADDGGAAILRRIRSPSRISFTFLSLFVAVQIH